MSDHETNDHAVRIALLEQSMTNITAELHAINKNIGWLVKLVGAAIIVTLMRLVLVGGLAG